MNRYTITVNGHTFDVQVLGDPTLDRVEVMVDGESLTVDVRTAARQEDRAGPEHAAPSPSAPARATSAARIVTAPLPGVVKSVDVKPGQKITGGDKLLVIEAMKMDNVLRATRGGVVDTVHAVEGRQVNHGEPLLEYRD